MMEKAFVPFKVFGDPVGDAEKVLEAVCIKAVGHPAYQRAVNFPAASREISSPGTRPEEEILVERFINYAKRTYRNASDTPLLCVAYRGGWKGFSRTLKMLKDGLPYLDLHGLNTTEDASAESTNVLILENTEAVSQFQREVEMLGTLHGAILSGGILRTPRRGLFFIVTHNPSIQPEALGRLLRTFLESRSPELNEEDRHSMLPIPVAAPVSPRSSSSQNVIVVRPTAVPKQEPLSERISKILNPPIDSKKPDQT